MAVVDQPQAKKRLHRKVRSGCQTCRLRRVKCDEGFPACRRCLSMGRVCDGYGVWGGGGALCEQNAQTTKPLRKPSRPEFLLQNKPDDLKTRVQPLILPGFHVSVEEQSYLEWFIHGTATNSPRVFGSPFWDPIILRATMQEPMVLQALLALSAVHKRKVLDPANLARDGLPPDSQEIFLLKQYNRAIRSMQNILSNNGQLSRSRLILAIIMCQIFTLLEYFRGQFGQDAGQMHLATGSKLVKLLLKGHQEAGRDSILVQFFNLIQDQTHVHQQRQQSGSQGAAVTPELRSVSLEEASNHLDALLEMLAHAAEQFRRIPLSETASRQLLKNEYAYLLSSCEAWNLAFEATIADKMSNLSPEDAAAWMSLRYRYIMGRKMADKCLGLGAETGYNESTASSERSQMQIECIVAREGSFELCGNMES